jgi:hypothetical protein
MKKLILALLFSSSVFAADKPVVELTADYNQFAYIVINNQPCKLFKDKQFIGEARMERYDGEKLHGCYAKVTGKTSDTDLIVVQWEDKYGIGNKDNTKNMSAFIANRFLIKIDPDQTVVSGRQRM